MSALKLPDLPVPERLRKPLAWVGYPLFAVLVFVLALYASLPRDRIQDQVLTLASDFLGADVKTDEFGLTLLPPGVKGTGVTITQRQPQGVPIPTGPDGKPQKPWRIPADDARLGFGLYATLRSRTDLDWKAHVGGGSVAGGYRFSPEEAHVELDIDEVQLKSFPMLPAGIGLTGVPIEGQVSLEGNLTAPTGLFAQSDGKFELTIDNAVVGDGKAKINLPGSPLPGGLTLPKVTLGRIAGGMQLTKGRAELHDLKGHSPDLDVEIQGYVDLRDPLNQSQLHLFIKLKPSEALIKREASLEMAVNLMGGRARRPDGFFGLTVEGSPTVPNIQPTAITPAWLGAKPPQAVPATKPSTPAPPTSARPSPPTPPRIDPGTPAPPPPPLPPPPSPPPAESPSTPTTVAPPPPPPSSVLPGGPPEPTSAAVPPPPRLGVSARGFLQPGATAVPVSDEARNTESPAETLNPPPQ